MTDEIVTKLRPPKKSMLRATSFHAFICVHLRSLLLEQGNKMQILQVCPVYYPHIGGTEDHVKNISERLAKKHDVTVFTTDPSGKLRKEEVINGVQIRRFKAFAPSEAYYFSSSMLRALKTSEFDVVHGHDFHALPMFFSRYAKCKRFVVTPHYHGVGHTPFRNFLMKFYKPIGGKALEDAEIIICVSNFEKNLLQSHFNLGDEKIAVIPNGIDLEEFKKPLRKRKQDHRTILCVSRVERYKGIDCIVRALPKLQDDIELEIVGKGTRKDNLMRLVSKLGLLRRVRFFQDLPRSKLLQRYVDASLFVLLSKHEAYGICVAEALACGTPCIVADTSALKEWVDNENCFGISYPINLDELVNLVNDAIGKSVVGLKLPDWDEITEKLIRLYNCC